ncbi:hypothetical protein EYF80_005798 [Liparis tanakae]|uniref:Uncharacterized protein n=1 Tax=Liparis tanakae TaxID=230148 RepID=A0A4Z2J1P1_9TELE|nr:hypothetical protein EYF80_005798 [Liparis tanakae]
MTPCMSSSTQATERLWMPPPQEVEQAGIKSVFSGLSHCVTSLQPWPDGVSVDFETKTPGKRSNER